MARIQGLKRLYKEDFEPKDAQLIETVGYSFNIFGEEIVNAFDGKISIENLNITHTSITTTVDGVGAPLDNLKLNGNVINGIAGIVVIKADAKNDGIYPTAQPFITYTINSNGLIVVEQIAGLPAGEEFNLVLQIIGN